MQLSDTFIILVAMRACQFISLNIVPIHVREKENKTKRSKFAEAVSSLFFSKKQSLSHTFRKRVIVHESSTPATGEPTIGIQSPYPPRLVPSLLAILA